MEASILGCKKKASSGGVKSGLFGSGLIFGIVNLRAFAGNCQHLQGSTSPGVIRDFTQNRAPGRLGDRSWCNRLWLQLRLIS
jgi:hypothetical protein